MVMALELDGQHSSHALFVYHEEAMLLLAIIKVKGIAALQHDAATHAAAAAVHTQWQMPQGCCCCQDTGQKLNQLSFSCTRQFADFTADITICCSAALTMVLPGSVA